MRSETILPVVLWSTMLGSALLIAPGVLFYYDITPKIAAILFGTAGVLILHRAWIPGLVSLHGSPAGRMFLWAAGLNAVSLVFSTIAARDPALAFTGSEWRRMGLAVEIALLLWAAALAGWAAGSPRRVTIILRGITIAGLVGSIYGAAQYFGGDPFLRPGDYTVGEGYWAIVRPPGTLGHAGYFATFLLSGVYAGAAIALNDERRIWRLLGLCGALLGSLSMILSGTRSAIAGLLTGGLLLAIWFRPAIRAGHLAALAGLAAAATAFYVSGPGQRLRARTRWYVEDAAGGGRLLLWRDSLKLGAGHWAAGAGLESFSAAFLPYQSDDLTRVLPDRYYESPHNIVLDVWTGQGLPGLAAFLVLLTAAGAAIRNAAGNYSSRGTVRCLAAGMLALCVSGMFLPFVAVTKLFFYAQIALIAALASPAVGNRERNPAASWVGISAVAASAWFALFAVVLLRADFLLQKVRKSIPARQAATNVELYQRFLAAKPAGMYADLWFSREMYVSGISGIDPRERAVYWRAGMQAAERALSKSETPQSAAYSLATYYAEEGNVEKVEEYLRTAARAAPQWYKPYWMLAQLLNAAGKREQAAGPIQRAMELSGSQVEEVRATWERINGPEKPPAGSR